MYTAIGFLGLGLRFQNSGLRFRATKITAMSENDMDKKMVNSVEAPGPLKGYIYMGVYIGFRDILSQ